MDATTLQLIHPGPAGWYKKGIDGDKGSVFYSGLMKIKMMAISVLAVLIGLLAIYRGVNHEEIERRDLERELDNGWKGCPNVTWRVEPTTTNKVDAPWLEFSDPVMVATIKGVEEKLPIKTVAYEDVTVGRHIIW